MGRELFINLPVRELERSKAFFTKLGFEFNPQFTDENAACMVVSDKAYVMLLRESFFRTFTKKPIADAKAASEGLFAFSCTSRDEVDAVVAKALEGGGKPAMDPQDHGFMYGHSFYDLDDHHWEVFWMDPSHVPS
jgi:hypothetical protein